MAFEVQLLHFFSADLLPLSIGVLIEVSGHRQPGGRGRPADTPEHNPQCPKRLPLPVPADLAEEAMLNRIPLRAPRRVVTDGYGQPEAVAEMLLQIDLPGSGSTPVATAAVCQDQQVGGLGIGGTPFFLPPPANRTHRELRGVVRQPNYYATPVPGRVINAERQRRPFRLAGEIVFIDLRGFPRPSSSAIPEVPDQLSLFGVHADDGQTRSGKGLLLGGDVAELLIPLWAASTGPLFPFVGPQGKAHAFEQAGHSACADRMAPGCQAFTEMLQAASHPPLFAHRVPRLFVHEHSLQSGDDAGVLCLCRLGSAARAAYAIVLAPARRT